MTVENAYNNAVTMLEEAGVIEARLDARLMLQHILGWNHSQWILNKNANLSIEEYEAYCDYVTQRCRRKPLQQIIQEQAFMGMTLFVNEATLIPRPETEELVELAISILKEYPDAYVMDIGTGSGCIPIALCHHLEHVRCTAVDISKEALDVAKNNAKRMNVDSRIDFCLSNLFEKIVPGQQKYDMLISNPPYIPTDDIADLMEEVRCYEPLGALDGGKDGLDFYRIISKGAKDYLKTGGHLIYEIGYNQREAITDILVQCGYHDIRCLKDLSGNDRIIHAIF